MNANKMFHILFIKKIYDFSFFLFCFTSSTIVTNVPLAVAVVTVAGLTAATILQWIPIITKRTS